MPEYKPFLLIADLDGTLHGNEESLKKFNEIWLREHAPKGSKLVYNTGRTLETYGWLKGLLEPDALIVSDGTELYMKDSTTGALTLDPKWDEIVSQGWDKKLVVDLSDPLTDFSNSDEVAYMKLMDGCKFKHEFIVPTREEADRCAGILQAHSNSECWNIGVRFSAKFPDKWWVTITSRHGGKGESSIYIRNALGFESDNTVTAGDSGNDRLMFEKALFGHLWAILVANSSPELTKAIEEFLWMEGAKQESRIIRAGAGFADGVMEGLSKLGFW